MRYAGEKGVYIVGQEGLSIRHVYFTFVPEEVINQIYSRYNTGYCFEVRHN